MDNDAMPFLLSFEQNGDWATFGVLADYFADNDDSIGEEWALWIRDNEAMPVGTKRGDLFMWCWSSLYTAESSTEATPYLFSYHSLILEMPAQERIAPHKSDNPYYRIANAYARLLCGWRRISEKDREAIMNGIRKG